AKDGGLQDFMFIKLFTSNPQSLRDSSLQRELLTITFMLKNIPTNCNLYNQKIKPGRTVGLFRQAETELRLKLRLLVFISYLDSVSVG
ncbi:MAG: hypothetical protein IKK49_09420, partial [Clostridia bacterium]|nr:hypothetical protein [Clostridia bacterium]